MYIGHKQQLLLTSMILLVKFCTLIILTAKLTRQVNIVQIVINTAVAQQLDMIIHELLRPLETMKKKGMY